MSISGKNYPCISEEMRKGTVCHVGDDIKGCVYGVFRGQFLLTEGLEAEVGGCCQVLGLCVSLRRGASLPESTWGREHSYHLECLLGLMESGEAFYISEAPACHSFSFSCPLHFPSPAWFSDTSTAFPCLLQPSGHGARRTGRIPSSWARPSSQSWFVFCFSSFFLSLFSLNISVLLLCVRPAFLFPSSLPFYCF